MGLSKTILNINGSLLCVPSNHTGVITVSCSKDGNRLACIVTDIFNSQTDLSIGDSLCIRLMAEEFEALSQEFVMPNFTCPATGPMDNDKYGMEICIQTHRISIPLSKGGAITFVITINRGNVSVDAGSITANNLLLDYYNSKLNVGDEVRVTLKRLDSISPPLRARFYDLHQTHNK